MTKEIYRGVSYYWIIPIGIFVFWVAQFLVIVLYYRMDGDSPLRIGNISGKDVENPDVRNVVTDYRFWAILISTVAVILWFGVNISNSSPQYLLESIGLAGPPSQLSPSGMSLVKYYLGVWWGYGVLWWVVSALCFYIIWENPYRFRRYRLELLEEDCQVEWCELGQRSSLIRWEKHISSKLLHGSIFYAPDGKCFSTEPQEGWGELQRKANGDGDWVLSGTGKYKMRATWTPHFTSSCDTSLEIRDGMLFAVGTAGIKCRSLKG